MKRKSKQVRVMRLWEKSDAQRAVPYLRSVLGSLREHWLDARTAQTSLDREADDHAPRNTKKLLLQNNLHEELDRAQTKFDDALEELAEVDVFLLDPVNGLALMPFRKTDDLAWYYIDLFDDEGIAGWRFHDDPIDACRPIEEADTALVKAEK